jgi:hypothetical protein
MKGNLARLLGPFQHQAKPRMDWNTIVKRTVSRFARGNIAAQNGRILLPEEQELEHREARKIALKWKARASS